MTINAACAELRGPQSRELLEHLEVVISSQRFLEKQGLNNEVPFFICPYRPEDAVEMDVLRGQLVKRLEQRSVRILEVNLYDLALEILEERKLLGRILQAEAAKTMLSAIKKWESLGPQDTEVTRDILMQTDFMDRIIALMQKSVS